MGTNMTEQLLQSYDFNSIQSQINKIFPSQNVSFKDLILSVISGEQKMSFQLLWDYVIDFLKYEMGDVKVMMITLILIGIVAAVFINFSKVFENHQISDISYYLLYLLMITVLLKGFELSVTTCKSALESIITFIKILVPTFYIAIGVSGSGLSATVFYQIIIVVIFIVESLLLMVVIPCIYAYSFLCVVNGISDDDKLSMMIDILEKAIRSLLNIFLLVVTGISILQSMISPVIDGVKVETAQKIASSIPGVGSIADSVTEIVLGSAILIKNGIGVVMFILLIALCMMPILKLVIMSFVFKVSAAVMGLICDKRMAKCTQQVGEVNSLLIKTLVTSLSLFLITIAVVVFATNRGY